jgi:transcriptional regulator with XRE-family HTH domain
MLQPAFQFVPLRDAQSRPMTPEDLSLHIGQRLAQRRLELKLSLADVSDRCGVSLQQIHRYEIGQNAISAPMLWQLSKCLDAPIDYFFEGLDAEDEMQVVERAGGGRH